MFRTTWISASGRASAKSASSSRLSRFRSINQKTDSFLPSSGSAFRNVLLKFVMPVWLRAPETIALLAAERGQPAGHLHHTGFGRGSGGGNGKHGKHRRRLLFERQMMQDVGEGFAVHQAMLDGHVHQFLGGVPGSKREGGIQRAAHTRFVIAHFIGGGPVRGPIRWQIAGAGIYAEREQLVEAGMKCGHIESAAEQVPIERLQMAEIEDEAMPLRDGTLVQRGRIDQIEKAVGLLTRSIESLAQFRVRCHTGHYFSKRVWWGRTPVLRGSSRTRSSARKACRADGAQSAPRLVAGG